ncbi:SNARE associated Golgi protein [uncultured archaeon]|nr:SNARE associated Golgi protein [uncultured archaeon]
MEILTQIIDVFLHLDSHLNSVIQQYGALTYAILFFVIFLETGFVVTPFLPGDSLLFAAGTFASLGSLDVKLLFLLLTAAAILGDTVNYWIGHKVGPKVFREENVRFLNKNHLKRTEEFYEKHGGKTIIIARFIPVIRTFAPFVAGIGRMSYPRFLSFNVIGGVAWNGLFIFGGYYFGNIPVIKQNFSLAIIAIIVISFLPGVVELARSRVKKN